MLLLHCWKNLSKIYFKIFRYIFLRKLKGYLLIFEQFFLFNTTILKLVFLFYFRIKGRRKLWKRKLKHFFI